MELETGERIMKTQQREDAGIRIRAKRIKGIFSNWKNDFEKHMEELKLLCLGIVVGVLAGSFASLYKYLIHGVEDILNLLISYEAKDVLFFGGLLFIVIVLAVLVGYIKKFEPLCGGSGIPQVKAEIKGHIDVHPVKLLFSKIVGGALTALSGLSVGREGPSIQIGAMSGKLISNVFRHNIEFERFLITCGASAGLAGAFNAPVAGMLFAIEEVHRKINRKLLICIMAAVISADLVSKLIYGTNQVFQIPIIEALPVFNYTSLIIFGMILAVLGVVYLKLMEVFMKLNDSLKIPETLKMIPYFVVPVFLLFTMPEILGGGGILMHQLLAGEIALQMLVLFFVCKLVFAIFSFSSGVPGGIFFPILVLGAIIGSIYGQVVDPEHLNTFIILGMAGYLTAIVRAPITSVILIFEMTGNMAYLLPLTVICLITYSLPNYLNAMPVYDYLLKRLLNKRGIEFEEED